MSDFYEKSKDCDLDEKDLEILLSGGLDQKLFECSRKIREANYGDKVYIRAVIDISNFCNCNCAFCGNNRSQKINRYRMLPTEIISCIEHAALDGIDIIHLASGVDPQVNEEFLTPIFEYCDQRHITLELALGARDYAFYKNLYALGGHRYILKFETSNAYLFGKYKSCFLEYDQYLDHLYMLKDIGFKVGTGNIIGLPTQNNCDIQKDLQIIQELQPDMISSSVFVPNPDSRLCNEKNGDPLLALRFLSIINIMNKCRNISIPTNSTFGMENKINALKIASNVISVNYTFLNYESSYSIYSGKQRHRANLYETMQFIKLAGKKTITFREFSNEI